SVARTDYVSQNPSSMFHSAANSIVQMLAFHFFSNVHIWYLCFRSTQRECRAVQLRPGRQSSFDHSSDFFPTLSVILFLILSVTPTMWVPHPSWCEVVTKLEETQRYRRQIMMSWRIPEWSSCDDVDQTLASAAHIFLAPITFIILFRL